MKWLADYFKLDLSIKINATHEIDDTIEWDDECIAVVKRIFRKDFETSGYDVEPSRLLTIRNPFSSIA
jgi:hypothetical protein